MKYRLNFMDSSLDADRFLERELMVKYNDADRYNRFLLLDEGQALIFKIRFPDIKIQKYEEV